MRSILLILLISLPARAALVREDPSCRCEAGAEDVFDNSVKIDFGALNGQCVNTCYYRPAHATENGERWGNFLHAGRYWQASVPVNAAESVDVFFENFYHGISHVFLSFQFAPGTKIPLFSQRRADLGALGGEATSVVISAETALPAKMHLSFWDGAVGNYPMVYRLLSLEQMRETIVGKYHHHVRRFRLKLSPVQAQELLRLALHKSEVAGYETRYWLLTQNCATAATDLLQAASQISPDWLDYSDRAIPFGEDTGTIHWLRMVDLLDESFALPNLEDENRL